MAQYISSYAKQSLSRYDPFYISKETLRNLYTGLPVRKNFALKPQLDWVVNQLQAGGFWHKWNNEQFSPQVFNQNSKKIIIHTFFQIFIKVVDSDSPTPLTLNQLKFAFLVLSGGLAIAFVIWLIELLIYITIHKSW